MIAQTVNVGNAGNPTPLEVPVGNQVVGLSFYSGAMGLDLGLEVGAGVRFLLAADSFAAARATIRANRPQIRVLDDAARLTAARVRQAAGLGPDEAIDVVAGCPPCPPWSVAGKRRGVSDPRGMLLPAFVDLSIALRPRLIGHENVKGLASAELGGEKGGLLKLLIHELRRNGYRVAWEILNAADYGAPQDRERLILIASIDADPVMPEPTHSRNGDGGLPKWRTLRDAVQDLPNWPCTVMPYPPARLRFFAALKAGQSWYDLPPDMQREALGSAMRTEGGRSFCRRLSWDRPSPTLMCEANGKSIAFCHPDEDRPLSVEEYRRVQGFPGDWIICGSAADQYRQIGNAVPVQLSTAVGRAVAKTLGLAVPPRPTADLPVEIAPAPPRLSGDVSKKGDGVLAWLIRLPGDHCPFATATCSKLCYAKRNFFPRHASRHEDNYQFAGSDRFVDEMAGEIRRVADMAEGKALSVCLHGRGEFYSLPYLRRWREVMERTADCANLRYYVYTRAWVNDGFRAELEAIGRELKRVRINLSVDRDNAREHGVPERIGDGLVTWLAETDADLPPAGAPVDLVFRSTVQRDLAPAESLGGFRVCPNEAHLYWSRRGGKPAMQDGKPARITCGECRLCIDRSFAEWEKLKGAYGMDGDKTGTPPPCSAQGVTAVVHGASGSGAHSPGGVPRVISLFTGCGGMDLGFEGGFDVPTECVNAALHPDWIEHDHGNGWVRLRPTCFRTVLACDIRESARRIWVRNFARRGHSPEEFHLASIVDLVKAHRRGEFSFPEADVVTGGFCCQDFSLAGKRKGFKSGRDHLNRPMASDTPTEESRGMLYMWMREVVGIVKPKVVVAENVGALASLGDALATIRGDFASLGYHVAAQILRGPEHGIAQTRDRIIFIGLRKDALIGEVTDPYPEPTHGDNGIFEGQRIPCVTPATALRGLPEPADSSDPSQRSLSKAKYLPGGYQGQIEVPLGRPGPTIRADHHGQIEFRRLSVEHGGRHADELAAGLPERRLTVRECARLQTFPDDFELVVEGTRDERVPKSAAYLGVGNAVPPLLAYGIAMRLLEVWPAAFGSGAARANDASGRGVSGGKLEAQTGTPSVVSLFAGCGGLDLGFEQVGFEIAVANELCAPAIATHKTNFPATTMVLGDITDPNVKDRIVERCGGRCDLVIGGPPCAPYSSSGERDPNDPRARLFEHYIKIIGRLLPVIAVMENVPLILSARNANGGLVIDEIYEGFRRLGYRVEHKVVVAADYGVPQLRKRVIILATRLGVPLRFPDPSHAEHPDLLAGMLPWGTMRDAVGDLEDAPEDKSWSHVFRRHTPAVLARYGSTTIGKKGCVEGYHEGNYRNPPDRPSVTIKTVGWPIHYLHPRELTCREAARVQSFPDSFRFVGGRTAEATMIGNAVPPLLARAVATSVREMLDGTECSP